MFARLRGLCRFLGGRYVARASQWSAPHHTYAFPFPEILTAYVYRGWPCSSPSFGGLAFDAPELEALATFLFWRLLYSAGFLALVANPFVSYTNKPFQRKSFRARH